ncbi:hypothetical protein HHK36_019476 [Tetracentron sinense]|uniref:BTB domain-containing protein n=1 Tax=Tetracentron sinense TaxID=13715 RepID=A0A834YZZ8_TETSI|nr:hypothetical protein HHK36_019476 [Tetracentron sinense]
MRFFKSLIKTTKASGYALDISELLKYLLLPGAYAVGSFDTIPLNLNIMKLIFSFVLVHRGYKRFYRRAMLETSDFLKDDCLKINCTVGVVVSTIDCSRIHSIQVPDSDIGAHFGMLLENQEGSDVIFDVAGEKFHGHKLVLAARSHVFRAEFFDESKEDTNEVVITDLDPKVFKVTTSAILFFALGSNIAGLYCAGFHGGRVYCTLDTLLEDEELVTSSSCASSVSDTLAAKLLAAADKYGLGRLRMMCESYLCKDISVNSVAKTLALADRYHAMELKAVCLKFAAENLAGINLPIPPMNLFQLTDGVSSIRLLSHCGRYPRGHNKRRTGGSSSLTQITF